MSAVACTTTLNARERDTVLHALRYNAKRIRDHWRAYIDTAVKIEELQAKLEKAFAAEQLFDDGERSVSLTKPERNLLKECLKGLAVQLAFFHGRKAEADRIDAIANHIAGAA